MTSSLVGSEMCIRDSFAWVKLLRVCHSRCQSLCILQRGSGGPRLAGAETVSYTHLTLPTICSV
eukprot:11570583-Prorocentrum_lima.AAC.1